MTLHEASKVNDKSIQHFKVRVPDDVKQASDNPLKEGYIVIKHTNGAGFFMSPDPPGTNERRLVGVYPANAADILDWEVVPSPEQSEL